MNVRSARKVGVEGIFPRIAAAGIGNPVMAAACPATIKADPRRQLELTPDRVVHKRHSERLLTCPGLRLFPQPFQAARRAPEGDSGASNRGTSWIFIRGS
jgi:hypothetical protein